MRDLKDKGYAIRPDYFPRARVSMLRDELLALRASGKMKAAGIGKTASVTEDIRRDEIHWLEQTPPEIEELRMALNRELFLGLRGFEGHYAYYPAGGFYRRHLDRFRSDDARKVSLILYLNENWKEPDGGKLRLYTAGGLLEVEPRAGTLVCFMSGEIEHEVLESHAPRMTFTGWFKT